MNIHKRLENDILYLCFDRAGEASNALSRPVIEELAAIIAEFRQAPNAKGIVLHSGKKDFVVGADINEFKAFDTAEKAEAGAAALQEVFNKLADLKVPTVAAIDGQALGGGLELALACDYRIATDSPRTKMGFPEVQLGLIPGAGGTQRAPRLVGLQAGLDLVLTGKRLDGKRALKMGLIDACVHPNLLLPEAAKWALKGKRGGKTGKKSGLSHWALEANPVGRKVMERKAAEMVQKSSKGFYPAPIKALDVVFKGFDEQLEAGLAREARVFGMLSQTRESHSLIHLFHATNAVKKHALIEQVKDQIAHEHIDLVGVIGAGFMGAGIATVCADKGIRTRLSDPNKESIGRALQHVNDFFKKKVRRRILKSFEANRKFFHVSPGLSTVGFSQCDVVIEAVFEDLKLKQKILENLEQQVGKDVVFASNTSALPIGAIASQAKHPERILGMHFFSPVEKMPLLEIVYTQKTAPLAVGKAVKLGQELGKQVIIVKDSPGFYTTRVLAFFMAEAASILSGGHATMEDIDKALTDFGFPVGPITLLDEVGIDVGHHVLETMAEAFSDRVMAPKGIKEIQESGRLGRKNGKGFYTYENGKKGGPDATIYDLIKVPANAKKLSASEIVDRCLLVFVNESMRCLEETVLPTPYEGDVGAVFGVGFPPFWGGPFKYVDHIGAKHIVEKMEVLAAEHGKRFEPAGVLKDHAARNQRFFPDEK